MWYPWLKKELEARGYAVVVPSMPNPDIPEITPWVQTLKSTIADNPAKEVLLVGHSIGCQTILRYLAEAYVPVGAAMFVAGWVELTGLDDTEKVIARSWLETPINKQAVRFHLQRSTAFFASNDPLVPLSPNSEFFRDQVGSAIVVLDGYAHFDEAAGTTSIPELLQYI